MHILIAMHTVLYVSGNGSTECLPRLLKANANSSPVYLLHSDCCLPPLVPCGSWTLLTQHWPCCIVSPCSSWIDPTPSSSAAREVPFPQLPTPTSLRSLCVSQLFRLCARMAVQRHRCFWPTDSWSMTMILIVPHGLCHFLFLQSLSSISSPLQWNSNATQRAQFENDEQSIILTRDYVCSGPQAQEASRQLWTALSGQTHKSPFSVFPNRSRLTTQLVCLEAK